MANSWKWVIGTASSLFVTGVAVGYLANKNGIPQEEVGRWVLKGATRRGLRLVDALRDQVPDGATVRLASALARVDKVDARVLGVV